MKFFQSLFMRKFVYGISFIFLFLLSLFPRAVEVINHNYLFLLDQGRDYMALRNIVVNHHFTLIGSEIGGGYAGITGIFQGPFYYYFLTVPFLLFNGDPYGGMVLMLIFSLASIAVGFIVGQKIFGKPFGMLVAFLIALSPPLISAARFIWNPHPSVLFLLLAFYFVYKIGSEKRKNLEIFLAGFLIAFTYNFEIAMTVPLIIALIVYVVYMNRLSNTKQYAFLFAGLLLPFFPMIFFEVKHNFLAVHGFLQYIATPHSSKGYGLINNHFDSFFLNVWDTFPHMLTIAHWIFAAALILPTMCLTFLEKNTQLRKTLVFFFLAIGATVFILSFLRNHIFMYYLIDLNLIYIFFFTYIIFSFYKYKQWILLTVILCILATMTIYGSISSFTTTKNDLPDYGGTSKIQSRIDAIDYIYKDANGKPFGLFIFTPSVFTDPFEYTVLWYGQKTYYYLPTKNMKGTFYLLMQPDPYNAYSYKGWMETVIKGGTVEKTMTLPSGLIIQKRSTNSL